MGLPFSLDLHLKVFLAPSASDPFPSAMSWMILFSRYFAGTSMMDFIASPVSARAVFSSAEATEIELNMASVISATFI